MEKTNPGKRKRKEKKRYVESSIEIALRGGLKSEGSGR